MDGRPRCSTASLLTWESLAPLTQEAEAQEELGGMAALLAATLLLPAEAEEEAEEIEIHLLASPDMGVSTGGADPPTDLLTDHPVVAEAAAALVGPAAPEEAAEEAAAGAITSTSRLF
jgi:hypothetical protein